LFYFLVWRDVKVRYKQTIFGAAWAIIQPFFVMVVFTIFFGKLGNLSSDGIPRPIFYYSALLPWTFFSSAINNAGNSLVLNRVLLTKVYFPRVTIPASAVFCGLVDFGIAFIFLFVMMIYYHTPIGVGILLWPVLLMLLVMLSLGVGMIFATLNVRYRDVRYTLPFITQVWLFLTPIIYPSSMVPAQFRFLLGINPLSGIIEGFRSSLIASMPINWQLLEVSVLMTVVIFIAGVLYFRRMERTFADIV